MRSQTALQAILSLLFCIPKKPTPCEGIATPVYKVENTRPISVVEFFNLFRQPLRAGGNLSCLMSQLISTEQRGLIPGRSILDNISDMEHRMMEQALMEAAPLAIMVDFRAALPSASHDYMHSAMGSLGVPEGAPQILSNFYNLGRCTQVHAAGRCEGLA